MEYLLVVLTLIGNTTMHTERFATKQECLYIGNAIKNDLGRLEPTTYRLRPDLITTKCYQVKPLKGVKV